MSKSKKIFKASIVCIGFIIAYFVVQFIISFIFVNITGISDPLNYIVVMTIIADIIFLAVVAIIFLVKRKKLPKIDENAKGELKISLIIFAFFIGLFFSISYSVLSPFFLPKNALESLAQQNSSMYSTGVPLFFLMLLILQPITEEILFRRLIFSQISCVAPKWLALCISSLAFGLVHAAANIYLVPITFIGGLVFGYVFIKTKSLLCAILAHSGANAAEPILNVFDFTKPVAFIVCAVSVVLCITLLIMISKDKKLV